MSKQELSVDDIMAASQGFRGKMKLDLDKAIQLRIKNSKDQWLS